MSAAAMRGRFLGAVLACLALFCFAEDPVIPPSEKELLGAWSGYEEGCVYFYRLVLDKQGRGTCQVVFTDDTVDSYVVDHWQIVAGKLEMQLTAAKEKQDKIEIRVVAFDNLSMQVTVAGSDRSWQRTAVLFNEREFLKKLEKSKSPFEGQGRQPAARDRRYK
jgi:hypothetical protein